MPRAAKPRPPPPAAGVVDGGGGSWWLPEKDTMLELRGMEAILSPTCFAIMITPCVYIHFIGWRSWKAIYRIVENLVPG